MKTHTLIIAVLALLLGMSSIPAVFAADETAAPQAAPAAPSSATQSAEAKNLFYAPNPAPQPNIGQNPAGPPPSPMVPVPGPQGEAPVPPPLVAPGAPGVVVQPPVPVPVPGGAVVVQPPAQTIIVQQPPVVVQAPPPIGLKYRILLKDRDRILNVNTHSFRGGQQIRLVFSSNINGYLYIIEHGSKGDRNLLFPDPRIMNGTNFVQAFMEYEVPGDGFFVLDETTGRETLHVFLSPTPLTELDLANLPGGVIPPPVWTRIETIIQQQVVTCTRSLEFSDGPVMPPPVPGVVPIPPVVTQTTTVGIVPAVYVVQYAGLLYRPIELLHYR